MLAIIIFAIMFVTLLINIPIAFSLGIAGVAGVYLGELPRQILVQRLFAGLDNFALVAIPLFIFVGEVMAKSQITEKLVDFAESLVGFLSGGLALVNILVSMLFGGISGSAVADTAAVGGVMIPGMIKQGYPPKYAAGVTASSATVGIIIPPSIPMIMFGVLSGASISELFVGGIIPGILVSLALMVVAYVTSKKAGYGASKSFELMNVWKAFKNSFWALLLPIIIMGGILGGIFTATEAAAVASIYSVIVACFIYRSLKLTELPEVLYGAGIRTSVVAIIIATSNLFGWVLSYEQVPAMMANFLTGLTDQTWLLLLMLNVFFVIIGTFLHSTAALIILVPLLMPVIEPLGIDVIHFGLIMTLALGIGQQTPPVGSCLFITSELAEVSILDVVSDNYKYVIAMFIILILVTYIPQLVLFLPNMFMG